MAHPGEPPTDHPSPSFDPTAVAAELRRAEATATPVALLTERWPDLTLAQARAVARARDELRRADGERQIGYKLGWTSAAMREALGIQQPNWGTLWASQMAGPDLDLDTLIHPKVEPELVFCSAAELSGLSDPSGPVTADDVRSSGGQWALGLEIVDPRFPSFEFDWLDNTADNSSAAAVVVGQPADLAVAPAEVSVDFDDGRDLRSGQGAAAMGDPYQAVAWLVGALAGEGQTLPAGSLVFTGGLAAPFDIAPGTTYELACRQGLGPVRFTARSG